MLLDVGMHLYNGQHRVTISRVTAHRAYAKLNEVAELEFNRDIGNATMISPRGTSCFRFNSYYTLETPESLAGYKRAIRERQFSKINVHLLSDEQLNIILTAANNGNTVTPFKEPEI